MFNPTWKRHIFHGIHNSWDSRGFYVKSNIMCLEVAWAKEICLVYVFDVKLYSTLFYLCCVDSIRVVKLLRNPFPISLMSLKYRGNCNFCFRGFWENSAAPNDNTKVSIETGYKCTHVLPEINSSIEWLCGGLKFKYWLLINVQSTQVDLLSPGNFQELHNHNRTCTYQQMLLLASHIICRIQIDNLLIFRLDFDHQETVFETWHK